LSILEKRSARPGWGGLMHEPAELSALRLLCCPRFVDEGRGWFCVCLERGLDWTALFQAALLHDVAPLAAHRLLAHGAERLDDEMREGLELYLEGERLKAQVLAGELAHTLECLVGQNIPAIPIKGPQLALALYGDTGLRSCRDLDILVRDTDVARTLAALEGLGYRHDAALSTLQIEAVRRYGGQYILFHPERAAVEPHWLIAPSTLAFDLDYERLWHRTRRSDFLGVPCLRLPPEEELLLLCLHGAKEQWKKLKWICDIAAFPGVHPGIDWERLWDEAAGQGCARMLKLGLALARHLLEAPLPVEVSKRVRQDVQAGRLAEEVIGQWGRSQPTASNPYRLSTFYWRMRERPRDRYAFAMRTVFTPRALHYGLLRLPSALGWGYYPIKLLWDYLLIPIRDMAKSIGMCGVGRRQQ
jgi:hypothetical protein